MNYSSRFVKEDETASEFNKAVHYLSEANGTSESVYHVNRVSDNMATLADELTREKVRSCPQSARALARAKFRITSSFMLD